MPSVKILKMNAYELNDENKRLTRTSNCTQSLIFFVAGRTEKLPSIVLPKTYLNDMVPCELKIESIGSTPETFVLNLAADGEGN